MARGLSREQQQRKRRCLLRGIADKYGGKYCSMWVEGTYQGVTYYCSIKTIWASNGEVAMWPIFRLSAGDAVRTYNLDGPFYSLERAVNHFIASQQAST